MSEDAVLAFLNSILGLILNYSAALDVVRNDPHHCGIYHAHLGGDPFHRFMNALEAADFAESVLDDLSALFHGQMLLSKYGHGLLPTRPLERCVHNT